MNLAGGGWASMQRSRHLYRLASTCWSSSAQAWVPHSSDIKGSRHGNLRELRVQHAGRPYRVLYAFDPRRCALLLIGGDKTGQDRWYHENVPFAEKLYNDHLETLRREGRNDG